MARQDKTNAMRMLDRAGIAYEALAYGSGHGPLDALSVAELLRVPPQAVFKTLALQGSDGAHYVCLVPGPHELDLKKAAAAFRVKQLRMLHADEIRPVTGYERGGCSPLGMKKQYPTALDQSALALPFILVSAGRIGLQMRLAPADLARACGALVAALTRA